MIGVTPVFFVFLYGDIHSLRALAFVKKSKSPLVVSFLNEFEWHNALRLSEFRKFRSRGEAEGLKVLL